MPSISDMSPRHPMRRMPSMQGSRVAALALLAIVVPIASCDKTIVEPSAVLPPVEAASVDANAGSWKMLVLTGPEQVVVPDPAPVTSPAYVAELQSVKAAQASMTEEKRAAVRYWTGAGVLRWNE